MRGEGVSDGNVRGVDRRGRGAGGEGSPGNGGRGGHARFWSWKLVYVCVCRLVLAGDRRTPRHHAPAAAAHSFLLKRHFSGEGGGREPDLQTLVNWLGQGDTGAKARAEGPTGRLGPAISAFLGPECRAPRLSAPRGAGPQPVRRSAPAPDAGAHGGRRGAASVEEHRQRPWAAPRLAAGPEWGTGKHPQAFLRPALRMRLRSSRSHRPHPLA